MRKDYVRGDLVQSDLDFVQNSIADAPEGYIVGTASTPSTDLHGHRVLSGAFDESIKTKGLRGPGSIKLLAFHNMEKVAGTIKRLETVQDRLRIEAQLKTSVSYVKDLYEITKDNGGLSFSVGFRLQDFKFVEDEATKQDVLVVEKGELIEVSIVAFPAQPEATMDFVKQLDTPSEFEKTLLAGGWAMTRNEAHRLMQLCKRNIHLFETPLSVPKPSDHPVPDAHQLKAAMDLAQRARSLLGSR